MQLLPALTSLHTLLIRFERGTAPLPSECAGIYDTLAALPKLTSLTVCDFPLSSHPSLVLPVSHCRSLRTLRVSDFNLRGEAVLQFFTAPDCRLHTLESLTLHTVGWDVFSNMQPQPKLFARFKQLQSCTVIKVWGVGRMLLSLRRCTQLRWLTIAFTPGAERPDPKRMQALLTALPALQVKLLPSCAAQALAAQSLLLCERVAMIQVGQFSACVRIF